MNNYYNIDNECFITSYTDKVLLSNEIDDIKECIFKENSDLVYNNIYINNIRKIELYKNIIYVYTYNSEFHILYITVTPNTVLKIYETEEDPTIFILIQDNNINEE